MQPKPDLASMISETEDGVFVLEPRETYDKCIVGVAERLGSRFVVYSKRSVLDVLADEFSDDEDPQTAAQEWYDYNANGGWHGEGTWAFLDDVVYG